MIKQAAGFIQNTVKPLVEELDVVLSKCKTLNLDKKDIKLMVMLLAETMIKHCLIVSITSLLLGGMVCLTIYFILR